MMMGSEKITESKISERCDSWLSVGTRMMYSNMDNMSGLLKNFIMWFMVFFFFLY